MSLYIERPKLYYDNNISETIINYFIKYQYVNCYFYYYKFRLWFSAFPNNGQWFNYTDNWHSINKEAIVFHCVRETPKEGRFQYYYKDYYTPNQNIIYIPFNWVSSGVVYTDNSGQTRAGINNVVQVFSVAKKIISSINETIPAGTYTDPIPTRGTTLENNKWTEKYDSYNNTVLVEPSVSYKIEMPNVLDKIIVFPLQIVDIARLYVTPTSHYESNNFVFEINQDVQFFGLQYPRFARKTGQLEPPVELQFSNKTALSNIVAATTPIIGNNTLSYLKSVYSPGTKLIYYQTIGPFDLTPGIPEIEQNSVKIIENILYGYYISSSPFTDSDGPKVYTTVDNPVKDFPAPDLITTWEYILTLYNNVWEKIENTSDVLSLGDITIYVFKYSSFTQASVGAVLPTNTFNQYGLFMNIESKDHTLQPCCYFQEAQTEFTNDDYVNNGVITAATDNLIIGKFNAFDKIDFGKLGGSNYANKTDTVEVVNSNYILEPVSTFFKSNELVTYGLDDNTFNLGLRQDMSFYNQTEQCSFIFGSSTTIQFSFKNTQFQYLDSEKMYKSPLISINSTIGRFTHFTINTHGQNKTNIIIYSDLAYSQRSIYPISYISNKREVFCFANRISDLSRFSVYISNIGDTTVTFSIQLI